MVGRIVRHGTYVVVGGLSISLAMAKSANFQPPETEGPPAAETAPDAVAPEVPGEPAPPPDSATPEAPAEPVPPPERPTGPTSGDPAMPADPVPPTSPVAPVDPAAPDEPAPPVEPPVPVDPEIPLDSEPQPPSGATPRPAPPDAFTPPERAYEERGSLDYEPPTVPLGAVVREPVSIHEARERVLLGDIRGACMALAVLSTRYPTDARVDYLQYFLQWRMGQPEAALAALERAVALEYYYPVGDYSLFMEPIQGNARFYAERVRRSVRELDARDVLIVPSRDELLPPPGAVVEE